MQRKRRKKKTKNPKVLFLVPLALMVALLLSFNLNIYKERQEINAHLERVKNEHSELLATLEREQEELKGKEVTEETIERIAREQLLLKKEGESVIIISHDDDRILETQEDDSTKEELERELVEKSFLAKILNIFSRD